MAATKKDQFSNVAFGDVTCSAANTLTFSAIQLAVGTFQGVALVLHRILYYPSDASLRELVAATDGLQLALTSSNRLTQIYQIDDPAIIDRKNICGIAAGVEPFLLPFVSDFSSLPGGGKIIAANPLYVGIQTAGAAAASNYRAQLDFTFIELADKDYIELIQAQLPANIG